MGNEAHEGERTLAEKLDHLFATIHPRGRGPYTNDEVARSIAASDGPTISASYIWSLRTGKKDNPTKRHLEALAAFFGVPPSYFFNEESSERINAELSLLATMRDNNVRNVALRASGLSAATLDTIHGFIERARVLEGLTDQERATEDSGT